MKKMILLLFGFWLGALGGNLTVNSANALEVVAITHEQTAVNLNDAIELYHNRNDSLIVQTASDASGVVNRIEVRATDPQTNGSWAVFALANTTDQQIDRLIVAPHYRLVGSGTPWPDLGDRRIVAITPSEGFALDRQTDPESDIFRVTLNPGAVITFIAELNNANIPQLNLWEPDAYKDAVNSYTLYKGIIIGIAGLLALFLTIIFLVKASLMFPAAAALAWAVLAYVCVDLGFINKIIDVMPKTQAVWRAVTETLLGVSFVGFLYAYLHLGRWSTKYAYIIAAWGGGLLILATAAISTPELTTGITRTFFGASTVIGLAIIVWMAIKKFDRAILIIPTWVVLIVWVGTAWATVNGQINNDIIQPALSGVLVLILLLISFNIMQHAFADNILMSNLVSDVELQALALEGSDDAVWDWEVERDNIFVGHQITQKLGLEPEEINGPPDKWIKHLHPDDRERFWVILNVILAHRKGNLRHTIRVRDKNNKYQWMKINAKPVIGGDGEVIRCVGTIRDVSEQKIRQDRLMFDAIHDNLTGLPNRELFEDRVQNAIAIAQNNSDIKLAVVVIDIDSLGDIQNQYGYTEADLAIVTVTSRIASHVMAQDTIARLADDQIGALIISQKDHKAIDEIVGKMHGEVAKKIDVNQKQIILEPVTGLARWEGETQASELIKNAQVAAVNAKNETTKIKVKQAGPDQTQNRIESQLLNAIKQNQISLEYLPIIQLRTKKIAGFEVKPKWRHPTRGVMQQEEFQKQAEKSDLIIPLTLFVLNNALKQLTEWRTGCPNAPVFVSVGISSHKMLNQDTVNDINIILKKYRIAPNRLKLEITQDAINKNPNNAIQVIQNFKLAGVGIIINEINNGYNALQLLSNLPADTIKISYKELGEAQNIALKYVVAMANELKIRIAVEDPNTQNEIEAIKRLGCEYAQGGVFGGDLGADSALAILQKQYTSRARIQA